MDGLGYSDFILHYTSSWYFRDISREKLFISVQNAQSNRCLAFLRNLTKKLPHIYFEFRVHQPFGIDKQSTKMSSGFYSYDGAELAKTRQEVARDFVFRHGCLNSEFCSRPLDIRWKPENYSLSISALQRGFHCNERRGEMSHQEELSAPDHDCCLIPMYAEMLRRTACKYTTPSR